MPENPYSPPLSAAQDQDSLELASGSDQRQRPTGITLLSILSLLGGVAMLLLLLQQFVISDTDPSAFGSGIGMPGIPSWILLFNVLLLAAVGTGAAIGMWNGTPWGWWLGAFYFMYAVFRNISAFVTVVNLADQFEATERGVNYYLLKYGLRVLINALVFIYFFKGNVLRFFGLEKIAVPKAVGMIVAVCVSIALATMAVGYVTP